MHAAADAADALGEHRDLVVGQDRVGQLLNAAVNHEPSVLAAAHDLAFHEQAEMLRLVQRGVERPERNGDTALRRLVKGVFLVLVVLGRNEVPRHVLAEGVAVFRPAVGQDEALHVGAAHGLDADEVAHFALCPVRAGHDVGNGVDLRILRRQVHEQAEEHVILVEREIVRHEERAGVGPVVHADADHVAGVQVAEDVPHEVPDLVLADVQEKPVVLGNVHPEDGPVELALDLIQDISCRHSRPKLIC